MDSEKGLTSGNTVATIFTEGKTDWQHLKKAKEVLQIDLNIAFHEEKGDMGDSVLLLMCKAYNRLPQILQTTKFDFPKLELYSYN